jgi:hypothetical protein
MLFFLSPDFIAPKADVSTDSCAWLLAYNPCQKISQPASRKRANTGFEASAKWWSTLDEIELDQPEESGHKTLYFTPHARLVPRI